MSLRGWTHPSSPFNRTSLGFLHYLANCSPQTYWHLLTPALPSLELFYLRSIKMLRSYWRINKFGLRSQNKNESIWISQCLSFSASFYHQRFSCLCNETPYLVKFCMQGTTELHVLHQIGSLAFIRSNNANLIRFGTSFQKLCSYLLHIGSFRSRKKKIHLFNYSIRSKHFQWMGIENLNMCAVPSFTKGPSEGGHFYTTALCHSN